MNRIDAIFQDARQSQRRLLMPFVCAGHPAPDSLPDLLGALERAGGSIAEIGIPFSDPIADGPVIASAMHRALERGATPESVFEQVSRARGSTGLGLVAMVSASIVYRAGGPDGFAARAAGAGFDGVIYPDVPLEESDALLGAAREQGLTATLLIAPTTSIARAEAIARACTGFVYLIARTGITGERGEAPDVARRVARLREWTELPIACGFGVSTPEHVRAVVAHADAAIVGSALVRRIDQAVEQGADPIAEAGSFVGELASAARGTRAAAAPDPSRGG
ncbi:MAG: tryptophan synthase subunit alpha [Phycisphaerales bacterium]|nr:tryptophan synthase subunit alpha [Phycisphaerales bacterium]